MLEIKKDQYIEGGKTFVDGQEGSLPMKFTLEE